MGRDAVGWNVMEWDGTVWDGMGPDAMGRDRFGCTRAAHTGAGTKKSCRSSSRLGLCPLDEAPVSEGDFLHILKRLVFMSGIPRPFYGYFFLLLKIRMLHKYHDSRKCHVFLSRSPTFCVFVRSGPKSVSDAICPIYFFCG